MYILIMKDYYAHNQNYCYSIHRIQGGFCKQDRNSEPYSVNNTTILSKGNFVAFLFLVFFDFLMLFRIFLCFEIFSSFWWTF